jgi:hypothetical protein
VLEQVLEQSRQDASRLGVNVLVDVRQHTENRVRLAGASLPVCKYRRVVPLHMISQVLQASESQRVHQSAGRVEAGRCPRQRWHQRQSTLSCWGLRQREHWSLVMRGRQIEGTCFRGIRV